MFFGFVQLVIKIEASYAFKNLSNFLLYTSVYRCCKHWIVLITISIERFWKLFIRIGGFILEQFLLSFCF